MTKIIGSPTRYIQGSGELKTIAKHVNVIGDHMFILVDKNIQDIVLPDLESGLTDSKYEVEAFNGECCMKEINRIIDVLKGK